MHTTDYLVFLVYFIAISAYGIWIYNRKKNANESAADYFLAEGSLTWWAIGASLIASNISAEQFIGMSGSGFAMGLAIASYEWMAAATLVLIAIFFLPIYLRNNISTMPQFLRTRYNDTVATIMAIFWLFVFVFVNLSSILYLGGLAVSTVSGFSFGVCVAGLTIFAAFITLGGMKVIGYTDVFQVLVLSIGGLVTTYIALDMVAAQFGSSGAVSGMSHLMEKAPDHFHMIFDASNPHYNDLPGLSVVIGGMWIANLYYWGCNQYITQRALGASLPTARAGLLFAAFLKLLMPLLVVIPGIAVYLLWKEGGFQTEMLDATGKVKADKAYPVLLNLLPIGLKGLSFAALTAAIVASLAGKANSISTIFTLDIYKNWFKPNASDKEQVQVGRYTIIIALLIGAGVCPLLGTFEQGIQFIQEFTGFISPGALAIFLMGFFWKKTTSNAALAGAILTFVISLAMKMYFPEIPFMNRMGITFLAIVAIMVVMSLAMPEDKERKFIVVDKSDFSVTTGFAIGSVLILAALAVLYLIFW
jgi:solute:Na+ symporter, SSS family